MKITANDAFLMLVYAFGVAVGIYYGHLITAMVFAFMILITALVPAGVMPVHFVPEGSLLPRFYGVAWVVLSRKGCYSAPIPFNVLIGWARSAWFYLKHRGVKMPMTVSEAYDEGLRVGHVVQEKHFR